ncbi:MAG: M28 family peptidase [Acidobacteriota bacterium]
MAARTARLVAAVLVTAALAGWSARTPGSPVVLRAQTTPARPPATASFDGARAFEHLKAMVAIGPRPAGSAEIRRTRAYITRQIAALGLTVQEQPFVAQTPAGGVDMVNLIVRLAGRRPDRLLFTGHYDTKPLRGQRFVGANDGGSSAAFLIELARVLATRTHEYTYELIWLDGEEAFCAGWDECGRPGSPDNTYGSRYFVQAAKKANAVASIKGMVLVDMIGDADLRLLRDTNSTTWMTDAIWRAAKGLAYGRVFADQTTAIEDDHLAFIAAGIPSVDLIDLDYPYWHTPDDTLDHVSARSLQTVGDVLLAALPDLENGLKR